MRTILIIGAGPAGMMAAITARRNGAEVILIERNARVGKKILSTGNGRCNFTNIAQEPIFYHSDEELFPWQVIEQFDVQKTIRFFSELGIYSRNRNGYMYPYSDQASAILDVLRHELTRLNIQVESEVIIQEVGRQNDQFFVKTLSARYQGDRLIIATGSKAAPKTGSDGSGYQYAEQFGHSIIPVVPALVQLRCAEKEYAQLAGIRVQGKVSLYADGDFQAADSGEIQLTNYGISGIPVFQVSRFAAKAIKADKSVSAVLDFMPDFSAQNFRSFLENRIKNNGDKAVDNFFTGLFHKKLIQVLLKKSGIVPQKIAEELLENELQTLCSNIKHYQTEIIAANSFDQAQVCAGGVNAAELNPQTLESSVLPGLHFAGEVIDVDGICGGYNLQWAWSSGYTAGKGAAL